MTINNIFYNFNLITVKGLSALIESLLNTTVPSFTETETLLAVNALFGIDTRYSRFCKNKSVQKIRIGPGDERRQCFDKESALEVKK